MGSQAVPPVAKGQGFAPAKRDPAGDYRRLLAALATRARRLGSREPEGAAQEALKRSLENPRSSGAVAYYFAEELPPGAQPPDWPLSQLFAWLHAVLHYVVREEQSRAAYRREVLLGAAAGEQFEEGAGLDPAANPLDSLLRSELQGIVNDCLLALDCEYRAVLKLRADGMKYKDIAARLGVNENTVATWISRAIEALGRCLRKRMGALPVRGVQRGGEE
jgi:RNA polymerase sigma factor (sigma-70 family)